MKILHIGDIHLRNDDTLEDKLNCLEFCADLAEDENVDAVLIPGDIFDSPTNVSDDLRNEFVDFLCSIQRFKTILIRGNHDPASILYPFGRLMKNVTVVDRGPAWVTLNPTTGIYCIPWPSRAYLAEKGLIGEGGLQAAQAMLGQLIRTEAMMAHQNGTEMVLLSGHFNVIGSTVGDGQPLIGREIEVNLADLEIPEIQLSFLNHIHKAQSLGNKVYYAGSLTANTFGETDEKGVTLSVTEGNHVVSQFIATPARKWRTLEAHVENGIAFWDASEIGDLSPGDHLRFRYHCTEDQAYLFSRGDLEEQFKDYRLKIVPDITRVSNVRSESVASAPSELEKLEAWCEINDVPITESLHAKYHELRNI